MDSDCPIPPLSAIAPESDEAANFQIIQDTVLDLWSAVNQLTSIRPPRHPRYRVTIFGSARLQRTDPLYEGVRQLAIELTTMGCDIVTGGGPGLMQAANEGSVMADPCDQVKSIGIRVDLGFEQDANPFVEQIYRHRTFFTRLHHFVLLSDAFVIVPGGIGTALEALMIWQLLQVKQLSNTPMIMVGKMWFDLVDWAEYHMLNEEHQLMHPSDLTIPQCVTTFDEAIAILKASHAQWLQSQPS